MYDGGEEQDCLNLQGHRTERADSIDDIKKDDTNVNGGVR